jgi:hypothetical protein
MKTTATIQPIRSSGVAMAILGFVILFFVAIPVLLFVMMNYFSKGFPVLFLVAPVVVGLIGLSGIVAGVLQFTGKVKFGRQIQAETSISDKKLMTEDRLEELERLKRRDMVTPEEYAAKRHEILGDI